MGGVGDRRDEVHFAQGKVPKSLNLDTTEFKSRRETVSQREVHVGAGENPHFDA